MIEEAIQFFCEDIEFELDNESRYSQWINSIISSHNFQLENIQYIFCSDEYLLTINKEYLDHDYYTDIITFNMSEENHVIEADIFISIERIRDNSKKLSINFADELKRVMIHGVLHLIGFDDKTEELKNVMRQKESDCVSLF